MGMDLSMYNSKTIFDFSVMPLFHENIVKGSYFCDKRENL